MCQDCVREYGGDTPDSDTPEVRRVGALIRDFYRLPDCSAGGPLHIVTDDFNVEDHPLDFCEGAARDWADSTVTAAALDIIAALRPLSLAHRARACWEAG